MRGEERDERSCGVRKSGEVARRKKREGHLHKVLGVPALFSTAYGNVGSSIYYALGVVALSALGLTPVVFMLTGLLFVTTAWSYAEATTMFPEAGGSSSFARHTFNEFVSFGAGWALMLDYIITIAISAFFVPNYLATFWPILKTWPYNSIGGIVTIIFVVVINVDRHQRGGAAQHHPGDRRPQHADAAGDCRTVRLPFATPADHADSLRYGAHVAPVHLRHLDRHRGLHRHRDHLEHGRGVGQPGARRAAGGQLRTARRARRVLRDLDGRSVGHAGALQRGAGQPHDEDRPACRGAGRHPAKTPRPVPGCSGATLASRCTWPSMRRH